ncbi:enoyl-CoA hydratase [Rhizobium sp. CRIBSB]|nr:enoyl-CoA hydratase [Rhizobium sp. CRIBSB]
MSVQPEAGSDSVVLFTVLEGGVALIRINRPERLNALNMAVKRALQAAIEQAEADRDVAVLVLTGGEKAFVAGTDISEMRDMTPDRHVELGTNQLFVTLRACTKPVIAAVEGYALGGGCELALNCDMIIAGEDARFGQPEIRVGIMPGAGGTQLLLRTLGRYRAMKLCLTGDQITAQEAEQYGLVSERTPAGEATDRAIALGRQIAKMPPLAVHAVKAAIRFGADHGLDASLAEERRLFTGLFASDDQTEGMTAFLEKRPPVYSGS